VEQDKIVKQKMTAEMDLNLLHNELIRRMKLSDITVFRESVIDKRLPQGQQERSVYEFANNADKLEYKKT
jgi:hypothetical protein